MNEIIETRSISHKKYTIPLPWNKKDGRKVTYYIATIHEKGLIDGGCFQIHEAIEGDGMGYGGSVLEFLMEDGTMEKVKGPFYKYEGEHLRILWNILNTLTQKGNER